MWVDGKTGYMMATLIRDFVPEDEPDLIDEGLDWNPEDYFVQPEGDLGGGGWVKIHSKKCQRILLRFSEWPPD